MKVRCLKSMSVLEVGTFRDHPFSDAKGAAGRTVVTVCIASLNPLLSEFAEPRHKEHKGATVRLAQVVPARPAAIDTHRAQCLG